MCIFTVSKKDVVTYSLPNSRRPNYSKATQMAGQMRGQFLVMAVQCSGVLQALLIREAVKLRVSVKGIILQWC